MAKDQAPRGRAQVILPVIFFSSSPIHPGQGTSRILFPVGMGNCKQGYANEGNDQDDAQVLFQDASFLAFTLAFTFTSFGFFSL